MSDGLERRVPPRRPRPVQRRNRAPVEDPYRAPSSTPQVRIVQLQQQYGNRAVTQLLTAQRAPMTFASTLSSGAYVGRFADQIARDLMAELTEFHPPTGSPFATWKPLGSALFVHRAIAPWRAAGTKLNDILVETLGFSAVKEAVNRGRDEVDNDEPIGPPAYKSAVALELRRLVSARIADSMAYLGPRYVAARNQRALHNEATKSTASAEPSAGDLVASQPIDRFLIPALLFDNLEVDLAAFRKATPGELVLHDQAKRTIDFRFETGVGLKSWIRVLAPADPTPEEVARQLYGDPARSGDLIVAAPLFGFHPRQLAGPARSRWQTAVAMPAGGDPKLLDTDPMKELLASASSEQSALDQAGHLQRTGANVEQVLDRYRLMIDAIDRAMPGPALFGSDPRTDRLRGRRQALAERAKSIKAANRPAEAARWDAQSADQLDVITLAADGVATALTVAQGFKIKPGDQDKIYSLPHHVWSPLYVVMAGYVDALIASDLTVPARALLKTADARSESFPIDMMEGILEYLRAQLEPAGSQAGSSPSTSGDRDDAQRLQLREQKIRERLVGLRERIRTDPAAVKLELTKLQTELDNLQLETSATANIAVVNGMWSALYDHLSRWGVITGKNSEYSTAMRRLNGWHTTWSEVVSQVQLGNITEARAQLTKLQDDDKFAPDMLAIGRMLRDRENTEMWIDLTTKIVGMVAIGLLTAGVGTMVEGGLVLGAGWSAASFGTIAVVSAAEAVTFTAINVALFEKDPTVLGTLAQLGENFLMFGAMRGISAGYGRFVGEAFAKSPAGKLLGGALQLETAALTALLGKYVHAKIEGRELTQAEARHVVLETLAFTVGMAVAARCFEPFMKSLQLRGAAAYRSMFGEVDSLRAATARRGQALAASGKDGNIAKVLEADAATMVKENALLERIRTRSADPKTPAGERLTPAELAQVNAAGAAGAQAYAGNRRALALNGLEPTSGNSFVVGPGELTPRVKLLTDEKVGFKEQSRVVDPLTGRPTVELVSGPEIIRLTEVAGSAGTVVAKPQPTPTMTGCFAAGTPVHTPLGLRAIDTLRPGDVVRAVDPTTGTAELAAVITAYTRTTMGLRVLRIGEQELRCSSEHPFLVADRGWVPAGELIIGEKLITLGGGTRSVDQILSEPGPTTVHNIEVEDPHTYAVGPPGLVVHNKSADLRTMSPELAARFNRLRAAGADPRALTQFEAMFRNLDGDSALMLTALDRMSARGGDPIQVLIKQYEAQMARSDARLRAGADQFQQRQAQLAKLKDPALKKLVVDPASPKDPAALVELSRRFEQRSKLELVQMMRSKAKFNSPIAARVLAEGKGVPVSEAGYAEYMANGGSIEVLRDAALVDRAAVHELITQYRQLAPPQLERLRVAGDSIADLVSREPDPGPRMRADADARMTEAIWERRRTAIEQAEARLAAAVGVRPTRAAERGVAAATHDGTIGAMETDIPGVTQLTVRGSPEAPQGGDPGPGPSRRYQPPESQNPAKPLPDSAHHHAEDRFVNHLDAEFQRLGITQQQLIGRSVRISVDQAVCQTCAAGVAGSRNGVLLQFSADHPGLRIEVADINTGSLSVFEGGVRTIHHERVPTHTQP